PGGRGRAAPPAGGRRPPPPRPPRRPPPPPPRRTPLLWDPHPAGPSPVRGADLVTPNRPEAEQLVPDAPGFGDRARELARRWSARAVTVTLGADGAVLSCAGRPEVVHIPVPAPRPTAVHDTCGAGDRFAVAAAIAMSAGAGAEDAVREAVAAASAFVADGAAAAFAETAAQTPAPELAASDPSW
uniref:PfkB family carbohydrate kinase n=1 Tax=Nocardia cyriacigeorgica TaxID=135487 RepID=UPI002458D2FB